MPEHKNRPLKTSCSYNQFGDLENRNPMNFSSYKKKKKTFVTFRIPRCGIATIA